MERAEILRFHGTWVQIPILLVTSWMFMGNLLSEPQVPSL